MTRLASQNQLKKAGLNPWFNCVEAAAHCGLAPKTIRNAVALREITVRRSSDTRGPFYIRLDELERWFTRRFGVIQPARRIG